MLRDDEYVDICGPPYNLTKFIRIDTDFTLQWLKVHGKKDLEDCLPKPKPTPGPKPRHRFISKVTN